MANLALSGLQKTGLFVSPDMFGANVVFEQTDSGLPTDTYVEAVEALGVANIRFGGGQADLDPDKANAAGELPVDGVDAINIVAMENGDLRPEVVAFLDWCMARQEGDQPVKTTLIIPTKHLDVEAYEAFALQIESFTQMVMERYGPVIAAFQIGNEHWEMGETAYGIKASLGAEAVERGMLAAGYAEDQQPDILVQMGTAGNNGSEFPATPGVSDFVARNKAANEQIIAQLSEDARTAIDGVTEHYYYNKTDYAFADADNAVKNINRDYDVWKAAFDQPLDLVITEWNVKTSATEQHGIVAASSLIKQVENMIHMGVDGAHIWALDFHSRTALTLDTDNGARLDDQGRLTNSAQGAAFDLMQASITGKELIKTSFANGVPGIEVSAYASATEAVFYVSSRTFELTSLTLDLGSQLPTAHAVEGVRIALDQASSNGRQWERGVEADAIEIDGQSYFYNEHDVDVVLSDLTFADATQIDLTLKPFEVIELTVDLSPFVAGGESRATPAAALGATVVGTAGQDRIDWTSDVTVIDAGGGVDTVVVDANRATVTMTADDRGATLLDLPGGAATLTLTNVERIEFADGTLALDTEGNSGQAYRLYQASFDRTPDAPGLAFWMQQLDSQALSLVEVAEHFLNSDEFATAYGENATLEDARFIDLLYANVLDRLPDQAGYDFWRAQQENNLSRQEILVEFSESAENKANVATAIDDGIWFT